MEEIWREIKGFEGRYEVSNLGRVRSLFDNHGKRRPEPRFLKPCKNNRGYHQVCLRKDGKAILKLVHRIVAETFIPNPLNLPEVNHLDELKDENVVILDETGTVVKSNLEWCDRHYNNNFGTHNERVAKSNLNHPKKSKKVLQIDSQGNLIREWPSAHEVSRQMDWDNGTISKACCGKRKTAYGYVWKYAD